MTQRHSSLQINSTTPLSFGTDESPLEYFLYKGDLNDGLVEISREENSFLEPWAILRALVLEFPFFCAIIEGYLHLIGRSRNSNLVHFPACSD